MDKKTIIKLNLIRVLCIISLSITIFSIRDTYAKYYERINTNYGISIKRWMIKVNDIDIIEESDVTQIINPIFEVSEYANNDILVPGRQAYFDLDIDYSSVDLNFQVNFSVEQTTDDNYELQDFKVFRIVEIDDNDVETEEEFPLVINIEETEETEKHLRVYFGWDDSVDNLMSDSDDTAYEGETENGNDHTVVKYSATLTFSQYIVEEGGGQNGS